MQDATSDDGHDHKSRHEDFKTRHAPTPIELPVDDAEASTDVSLKTQILRFVISGVISGILDFGLTTILQFGFGLPPVVSKAVGFICGTTCAYIINRRWTFRASPSTARFIAVALLYCCTFFVNVGIYTWLAHVWEHTFLNSLIAYVIAQGTATVINFVVQRTVIFRVT